MTSLEQMKDVAAQSSPWLSTYGMVTAERILGTFNISLTPDDLAHALINQGSIFHQFLKLPLLHVLNGIIMQQAHDYQVYVQKLYVDYLLSGEASKPVDSAGGVTREGLEELRKEIIEYGEAFHRQENTHRQAIAESQSVLIANITAWHQEAVTLKSALHLKQASDKHLFAVLNAIDSRQENLVDQTAFWAVLDAHLAKPLPKADREGLATLIAPVITTANHIYDEMAQAIEQAEALHLSFESYRAGFRAYILQVQEAFHSLPDYHVDAIVDVLNRESLHFDIDLGKR